MLERGVCIAMAALLIMAAAQVDAREDWRAALGPSTLVPIKDAAAPIVREAQSRNPPATAPAPPPAAQPAPQRTETIVYDSWTVTCQEGGTAKKTCVATLQVLDKDRRLVLLSWQIGFDKSSRLTTAIQIPTGLAVKDEKQQRVSGGISIKNGVSLKLGTSAVRQLAFLTCAPQQCEASAPMDDAFMKDLGAATTATATVNTADGHPVPFEIPLKGIDKVLASLRR
jgi:invasion protein IalB